VTDLGSGVSDLATPSNGGGSRAGAISAGYDADPTRSMSLHADAYVEPRWHEIEQREVIARSWQWVSHVESLRGPGSYVTLDVAAMPVVLVRGRYDIASNWKNVVDNFLECYHCHVAHPDFVTLVEMDTYRVTTHGIYSSHMARAGYSANAAYDVAGSTVKDLAVWWVWPNTCLMRYPGRGNFSVMQMVPAGPERTRETIDFYLETDELAEADEESIRYIDEVLQPEDIAIVESVQRGMRTPAFTQGRIVCDPGGSGLSEHGVHHFHGLVLDAYRRAGAA